MDTVSFAGAVSSYALGNVQMQASISVTKKAMDLQEMQAEQLLEMMPQQAPSFGHLLDVTV